MPQRVFCFVVVLILFFTGEIFSQQKQPLPVHNTSYSLRPFNDTSGRQWQVKRFFIPNPVKNRLPAYFLMRPITPNFYTENLSFTCKKELQIEKITSVPFRFRLGSLEYVNYLEQKPNSVKPR